MLLVTVSQMRAIEAEANARGMSYERMMIHAGLGLARHIQETHPEIETKSVIGLVGPGNNGGDTLLALGDLARAGWQATAVLVKPRPVGDTPFQAFREANGDLLEAPRWDLETLRSIMAGSGLLLDGVLGTGVHLPLNPEIAEFLRLFKQLLNSMPERPWIIAVDCPSGVDCDSGEAPPETIAADETVCMAAVKTGLLNLPALGLCGTLQVVDIDLPEDLKTLQDAHRRVIQQEWVRRVLPLRPLESHKGTFGTALLVCGSLQYSGAALLAGEAAYRIGTGLVQLGIVEPLHAVLAGRLPEATWLLLDGDEVIPEQAAEPVINASVKADAVLLGPGWKTEATTEIFLDRVLHGWKTPGTGLVIDADGLKLLAKSPDWYKRLPAGTILTPHPGEMSILAGISIKEIQQDRLGAAEHYSREWQATVVLKGAATVIASPDGTTGVIPVATPALARAGTGDVLAGMITGLRAQGLGAFEAAAAGAWIHAHCGLAAAAEQGGTASILASDVTRSIGKVLSTLQAA